MEFRIGLRSLSTSPCTPAHLIISSIPAEEWGEVSAEKKAKYFYLECSKTLLWTSCNWLKKNQKKQQRTKGYRAKARRLGWHRFTVLVRHSVLWLIRQKDYFPEEIIWIEKNFAWWILGYYRRNAMLSPVKFDATQERKNSSGLCPNKIQKKEEKKIYESRQVLV